MTRHEGETLSQLGAQARLYFVHVTDVESEEGAVVAEIQDPINHLKSAGALDPVLFRADLKGAGQD